MYIAQLDVLQLLAGKRINARADGRYDVTKTSLRNLVGKKLVGEPFSFWNAGRVPDLVYLLFDAADLIAGLVMSIQKCLNVFLRISSKCVVRAGILAMNGFGVAV